MFESLFTISIYTHCNNIKTVKASQNWAMKKTLLNVLAILDFFCKAHKKRQMILESFRFMYTSNGK